MCHNTIDDSIVLIENQLEKTDHTHLGQLLTYAAGIDAVTLVWIAKTFTDQHRAALDWLNSKTPPELNAFGLEIELWRIGDSVPAPKFNVVVQPNNWTKGLKQVTVKSSAPSKAQRNWMEFWGAFGDFLSTQGAPFTPTKTVASHWVARGLGRSKSSLQASAGFRDGFVNVFVSLEGPDAKPHYHLLFDQKQEIESATEFEFEWEERTDIQSSYVSTSLEIALNDRDNWPEIHQWMLEKMTALDRAFRPRIKELDASEWTAQDPED